jgi:hypothetical protein
MKDWDDGDLAKWLDAEASGADDVSDRLFSSVAAAHLQRLVPPLGLTGRVVAALPAGLLAPARPAFDPESSWWAKVAAFAALVVLGVGLALVSPRHVLAATASAVPLGARLLDLASTSVAAAVGLWRVSLDVLSALGEAAGHVATTGMMPVLLVANLAVAVAAFAGLKRLLTPREECV